MLIEATRAKSRIEELLEKNNKTPLRPWLNPTQTKLLKIIETMGSAKTGDLSQSLNLSQKGIYQALQKLVELGLINKTGRNKGTQYQIVKTD